MFKRLSLPRRAKTEAKRKISCQSVGVNTRIRTKMSATKTEDVEPDVSTDPDERKPFAHDEAKESPSTTPPLKHKHPRVSMLTESSDSEDSDDNETAEQRRERQMFEYFGHKQLLHYAREISVCDGGEPSKVLVWLRAIQSVPDNHVNTAILTSKGSLREYIIAHKKKPWADLFFKIAREFINTQFRSRQREAFDEIRQRPGEPLRKFNKEVEQLIFEAFESMPEDQTQLVRVYLSAIEDRELALKVVQQDAPVTLIDAIKAVSKRSRASDLLRPARSIKRMHCVEAQKNPALEKGFAAVVKSNQEITACLDAVISRLAALNSPEAHNPIRNQKAPPKPVITCFRCGKPGHFARACDLTHPTRPLQTPAPSHGNKSRQPPSSIPKSTSEGSTYVRCLRCRQFGHRTQNCLAKPPKSMCRKCGQIGHWQYDCHKHLN